MFVRLYAVACESLNFNATDSEGSLEVQDCPIATSRLMLAALAILRIHRSQLAAHLDLETGQRAYFAAIVAFRNHSIQNNDLDARGASILSQLWHSESIFKTDEQSTDPLYTQVRTRLSMSAIFDCFAWWRKEFGSQSNYSSGQIHQTRKIQCRSS